MAPPLWIRARHQRAAAALPAAVLVFLATYVGAALSPRVINTALPTDDIVVASIALTPTPSTDDDAPRLQAAIDEAAAAGGAVIFLRPGHYRLRAPIRVREGVTLRGEWAAPDDPRAAQGTIVECYAGRGHAEGDPAFTLERGSGLLGLTVWYPDQHAGAIVPYPWTIRTSAARDGDNTTVQDVTLVNPYQGIRIGPEWNELHTLRGIHATPLKTGLWIDTTTDIGRVYDVTFAPECWERCGLPDAPSSPAASRGLREYLKQNATGADVGRSDWEFFCNFVIRGCAVGVRFRRGEKGTTNAVMFGCKVTGCGTALLIEALNGVGLACTACTFEGSTHAARLPASFSTVCQFNSCTFTAAGAPVVQMAGDGTLTFQHATFNHAAGTALEAARGTLSVIDCAFSGTGPHVRMGADATRLRFLGNRVPGRPDVAVTASGADVEIGTSPLDTPRPDLTPHVPAPSLRPAGRALFNVADYGATPSADDNTTAFQRALDEAGRAGGGTVYVPAGLYRFTGGLRVPSGVELRGIFDVPHHTVSGGSVLMPLAGKGDEDATPFVQLETESGLRGLTFWYPEQTLERAIPYPWTIRALGPRCRLIDVTCGNAYQGADFWTHESTGHVIRYFAGAFLRRGLYVSKSAGDGWVEDVQFNPHYALRTPPALPRPGQRGGRGDNLIDEIRRQLDGIVFGCCENEHVFGTFLYAAHDGIAFRDDSGGANARVLIHGTDTGSRAAVLERVGDRGVEFHLAQLVPLGKYAEAAIITTPAFKGCAAFYNSQIWAGPQSATLDGVGTVILQQLNSRSGPIRVNRGACTIENAVFPGGLSPHIAIGRAVSRARIVAGLTLAGVFHTEAPAATNTWQLGNGAAVRPAARTASSSPHRASYTQGWEPAAAPHERPRFDASDAGGTRGVTDASCAVVADNRACEGTHVLKLAARTAGQDHAFAYFKIADGPFAILPDSVLSYSVYPLNSQSQTVGIDGKLDNGRTLRDLAIPTSAGVASHPGTVKGPPNKWTRVAIPIGSRCAGSTLTQLMAAYDGRGANGEVTALFDDIRLDSATAAGIWNVTATPRGGPVHVGQRIRLSAAKPTTIIRYTLDGSNPTDTSPIAQAEGIPIPRSGPVEIRFAGTGGDGHVSPLVFAELYNAAP